MFYKISIQGLTRIVTCNDHNKMLQELRRIFKHNAPTVYEPISKQTAKDLGKENIFTWVIL